MKKRILIFPFDLMSHYLRCITLAEKYKDYEILFAHSAKYNSFVTQAGFCSFKVETFDSAHVMACSEKFDFSWLNKSDIERVFKSQITIINTLKPDFVIGDTSPTLKMAAESTGVKYVSLMNGYMTNYYQETRGLSIQHPAYKLLLKVPVKIGDRIIKFAEGMAYKKIHQPFKAIRKENKLMPVKNYISEMEADENLICDDLKFFPQKNLPANYEIVGPLFYTSKGSEDDLINSLDPEKPTICVCLGSSGDYKKLQFLSENNYSSVNIIVAGDLSQTLQGAHIFHKEFVNLDAILPICAFMICHGGNGTIYQGLRHSIFMLCLTSHFEQEWNVQMLDRLKLGTHINGDPQSFVQAHINKVFFARHSLTF